MLERDFDLKNFFGKVCWLIFVSVFLESDDEINRYLGLFLLLFDRVGKSG